MEKSLTNNNNNYKNNNDKNNSNNNNNNNNSSISSSSTSSNNSDREYNLNRALKVISITTLAITRYLTEEEKPVTYEVKIE